MFKTTITNSRMGREWLVNAGLLLSLFALCLHLHGAATINFQSTPFDPDQKSDGTAMDSTFSFQMGGFENGFVPTNMNHAQWLANWTPAQLVDGTNTPIAGNTVNYDDSEQFFPGSGFFANNVEASAQLDDNNGAFSEGSQGYVWGYTTRADGEDGEWILLTNAGWTFPAAEPAPGDQPANEFWLTTDAGTMAVVGNLNGAGYEMQSELVIAVPEPSSGLLLLGSIAAFALRRRRNA